MMMEYMVAFAGIAGIGFRKPLDLLICHTRAARSLP
jgi:hypothetical protein